MNREQYDLKKKTARLSIYSNTGLLILKIVSGLSLGSVSIISEAIHSGMDLIAAVVAYISVHISSQPPDEIHEYGHGKFEDFSGLFEAVLIFIAAIIIIYEAISRLLHPGEGFDSPNLMYAGIAVMGISVLVNYYVSTRLMKVAKETESIALESDAWHLRTDIYSSLGVFIGLILITITGIHELDAIIAILVAFLIMKAAYDLTRNSLNHLIDCRLPVYEECDINMIIRDHSSEFVSFHGLRTRRAGPEIFIEFHLVVDGAERVIDAHDFTDHLESDLKEQFPRSHITIHVEPCIHNCRICDNCCEDRKYMDKT